jgi:hypothetical protein
MASLRVEIGQKADGFVFRLDPRSIPSLLGKSKRASQLPTVSIGFDMRADFEQIYGPIYMHIAELLTGLSEEELDKLGVVFVDSATNRKVYALPN